MKTIFCSFFLLFAVAAVGQTATVLSNTPAPIAMVDHALHAAPHAMAAEGTLLETSTITYAKGEVPLSELGSIPYETPLGDIARAYRKEHAAMTSKATRILDK